MEGLTTRNKAEPGTRKATKKGSLMEGVWALALDGQDSSPGVSFITHYNKKQITSPCRVPVSRAVTGT